MVSQLRAAILVGVIGVSLYIMWPRLITAYKYMPPPTAQDMACRATPDAPGCTYANMPIEPLQVLRAYRPLVLVVTIGAAAFILAPLLQKKKPPLLHPNLIGYGFVVEYEPLKHETAQYRYSAKVTGTLTNIGQAPAITVKLYATCRAYDLRHSFQLAPLMAGETKTFSLTADDIEANDYMNLEAAALNLEVTYEDSHDYTSVLYLEEGIFSSSGNAQTVAFNAVGAM